MTLRRTLLVAALTAGEAAIYVGAGGCDVSDLVCTAHAPVAPFSDQIVMISGHDMKLTNTTTGGAPSWLQPSHDGNCLFAVQTTTSRILSYSRTDLEVLAGPISNLSSGGLYPVKLDISLSGRILYIANYGDAKNHASVATMVIGDACTLTLGDVMPFHRSSVDPTRQANSHIHTVVTLPHYGGQFSSLLLAADLGGDLVYTLKASEPDGKLTLLYNVTSDPGAGPRHIACHPSLPIAYVVHEMSNALTTYEIAGAGELVALQSGLRVVDPSLSVCVGLSAVLTTSEAIAPVEMISCSKAAEVVVTPDGASLFASNRGFGSPLTNTIAGFSIDARGLLTNVSSTASGVSYPRGMALSADAKSLFAVGQGDGGLTSLQVAPAGAGTLGPSKLLVSGLATPTTVVELL